MGTVPRSTVNIAVLSVVLDMPSHGYVVGTRFVSRYSGLFNSTIPHVYRSLDQLESLRLVEASENPELLAEASTPLERQRKCFYRATATGARECRGWLAGPIPPQDARRELWIRLRSVRPDDFAAMLLLLDRFEHAILTTARLGASSSRPGIIDELAREDREAAVESQLRWLAGARQKLQHRIAAPSALP